MLGQSLILVPLAGIAALLLAWRGLGERERKFVTYALIAHAFASVALVVYHVYVFRGGDMYLYTWYGHDVVRLMRSDFVRYAPEAVKLTLQRETSFPFSVLLEGTTTASMMGLTSFAMLVFGDSMYAVCFGFSFFAFLGSVQLYKAVRFKLAAVERVPVLVGVLLVPSVVFWSSGIVKEAVVLGGLGFVLRGISELLVRRRLLSILSILPAAFLMALVKPYVFIPLVLALGAWFYAGRGHKLALSYKIVGVALSVGGLVAVTRFMPAYSVDHLAETLSASQRNFVQANAGAGSGVQIGDVDGEVGEQSLAGTLKWAPLGLLNALARPMLFDVRNVTMAIAALEMTALLWLIFTLLRRHGVRLVFREVSSQPPLLFAAVFVLALGMSVGLATGNLGSLSRYRVPMMPMYVGMALAIRARLDARAGQRRSATKAASVLEATPALVPTLARSTRLSREERLRRARRVHTPKRPRSW